MNNGLVRDLLFIKTESHSPTTTHDTTRLGVSVVTAIKLSPRWFTVRARRRKCSPSLGVTPWHYARGPALLWGNACMGNFCYRYFFNPYPGALKSLLVKIHVHASFQCKLQFVLLYIFSLRAVKRSL